jgi:hypothetical protein
MDWAGRGRGVIKEIEVGVEIESLELGTWKHPYLIGFV